MGRLCRPAALSVCVAKLSVGHQANGFSSLAIDASTHPGDRVHDEANKCYRITRLNAQSAFPQAGSRLMSLNARCGWAFNRDARGKAMAIEARNGGRTRES
jgi:hypothetical protein